MSLTTASESSGWIAGSPLSVVDDVSGVVGSTGVTEGSVGWTAGASVSVEALGAVGVTTSVVGAEESIGASSSADT